MAHTFKERLRNILITFLCPNNVLRTFFGKFVLFELHLVQWALSVKVSKVYATRIYNVTCVMQFN